MNLTEYDNNLDYELEGYDEIDYNDEEKMEVKPMSQLFDIEGMIVDYDKKNPIHIQNYLVKFINVLLLMLTGKVDKKHINVKKKSVEIKKAITKKKLEKSELFSKSAETVFDFRFRMQFLAEILIELRDNIEVIVPAMLFINEEEDTNKKRIKYMKKFFFIVTRFVKEICDPKVDYQDSLIAIYKLFNNVEIMFTAIKEQEKKENEEEDEIEEKSKKDKKKNKKYQMTEWERKEGMYAILRESFQCMRGSMYSDLVNFNEVIAYSYIMAKGEADGSRDITLKDRKDHLIKMNKPVYELGKTCRKYFEKVGIPPFVSSFLRSTPVPPLKHAKKYGKDYVLGVKMMLLVIYMSQDPMFYIKFKYHLEGGKYDSLYGH